MKKNDVSTDVANKLTNQAPKSLRLWEEYQGVLKNLHVDNVNDLIVMEFVPKDAIIIPLTSDLEDILKDRIGKRVSILHTDLKEKPYVVIKEDSNF